MVLYSGSGVSAPRRSKQAASAANSAGRAKLLASRPSLYRNRNAIERMFRRLKDL
jgi:hypothetical protein